MYPHGIGVGTGKHFTGKSHTVNSLLNEEAAKKQYLNRDQTPTTVHSREAHGLKLNLIDTGGPTELDFFSVAVSGFAYIQPCP